MTATIGTKNKAPAHADPNLHCVGMSPSTAALGAARKSLLHAATYRKHGVICVGERAINEGTYNCKYHVIYPSVDAHDTSVTTTKVMFTVICYPYYSGSSVAVYVDGVEISASPVPVVAAALPADLENVEPEGFTLQWVKALDIAASPRTDYNMSVVEIDGAHVASFTAVSVPDESLSFAGNFWLPSGTFNAGNPLLGYDRTAGQNGSISSLVQNQNCTFGERTLPSFLNASRRCLWSWACPMGRITNTSSTGYQSFMINSFRPYVKPRNLTGGVSTVPVDIAIAYRCDTGCKIKFVSSADSYDWTPTAHTDATPALAIAEGQLEIDPAGDEIEISIYRTPTARFELHSVSIYEASSGLLV